MEQPAILMPKVAASKIFRDTRRKILVTGGMNWIMEFLDVSMMQGKCARNMEIAFRTDFTLFGVQLAVYSHFHSGFCLLSRHED